MTLQAACPYFHDSKIKKKTSNLYCDYRKGFRYTNYDTLPEL